MEIITLQYCSGFCHTLTRISHGCTCVPILHPLPPPSPSHPPGCPSAPALSALFHASNFDWSSISHTVIHMFQCYSLKSSHPHLLPQSPKVCSLYLCLFLLSPVQGCLYHLANFHTYSLINILYWCFSFWLASLCKFLPGESMDRGSWWNKVHGVAEIWTWLGN